MHSKMTNEQYRAFVTATLYRVKDHKYVLPDEFDSARKPFHDLSGILADVGSFDTKEGVRIRWGTLKYTGKRIKTLVSLVPSIPNPMGPDAHKDYHQVSGAAFDDYIRNSGSAASSPWKVGPLSRVTIKEDGFHFTRWGECETGVKVVSYALMPTERYVSKPKEEPGPVPTYVLPGPNAMHVLRDAPFEEISHEKFDGYAAGGFFQEGPFSFTRLEAAEGGGTLVTKLYGQLRSGRVVAAFVRKPYQDNQPEDDNQDEKDTPMIIEAAKTKLRQLRNGSHFRTYLDPEVVMVRVPNPNDIAPSPTDKLYPDLIPCVVIIDGRDYRKIKLGDMFSYQPGKVRWLSPDVEIQHLEMTECPQFTVRD